MLCNKLHWWCKWFNIFECHIENSSCFSLFKVNILCQKAVLCLRWCSDKCLQEAYFFTWKYLLHCYIVFLVFYCQLPNVCAFKTFWNLLVKVQMPLVFEKHLFRCNDLWQLFECKGEYFYNNSLEKNACRLKWPV